jgi:multidrug efflux system outer membrane protein
MSRSLLTPLALAALVFASGCATLVPPVPAADPQIQASWPLPATTAANVAAVDAPDDRDAFSAAPAPDMHAADIGWRDFFVDPNLKALVARALDNNRDLRVAILNVERARAQYRIQRADRLPSLGASATLERSGGDVPVTDAYTAGVGLAAFELDLFGRVRNLSQAALQHFLAQEETQRAAQLSLIAEVANVYLTLAADRELLQLAQATVDAHEESLELATQRHAIGAASALDVNQVRTQAEAARVDLARYAGQVAQDTNALTLLVGAPVEADLLPAGMPGPVAGIAPLPAGLPSDVLLRRPDVRAAEHQLLAANANIGAARAAFFPSISLTGSIGSASGELAGLFESGTRAWNFVPSIHLPIFQGGRLRAGLGMARADRDIALARYERSIQAGFREVADALALTPTLAQQRQSQQALVEASEQTEALSKARYQAGRDSYLAQLDAQRTLYAARSGLVAVHLAEQTNRVALYRVLGGGWRE